MKESGKRRPRMCHIKGCGRKKIVGGHVLKADEDSLTPAPCDCQDLYILPICRKCNLYTNKEWMKTKAYAHPVDISEKIVEAGKEKCYVNRSALRKKCG